VVFVVRWALRGDVNTGERVGVVTTGERVGVFVGVRPFALRFWDGDFVGVRGCDGVALAWCFSRSERDIPCVGA
jgi:hypothetical protein